MRINDKEQLYAGLPEEVTANAEQNILELNRREIHLNSYPLRVYVEPTQRCNLACVMCDRGKSQAGLDMPEELFRRIEKELFPTAAEVDFFFYGEPFLAPLFPKMLNTSTHYRFTPKVFTNLTIMNKWYASLLVNLGVFVNVSLEAATPHMFDKIRRGTRFQEVDRNLILLANTARQADNPRFHLRISATLGSFNVQEAVNIVEYARERGIREVQLGAMDFGKKSAVHLTLDPEKAVYCLGYAKKLADKYRIRFSCPKKIGHLIIKDNHNWSDFELPVDPYWLFEVEAFNPWIKDCGYPWTQTIIRADGSVISCCQRHNIMGNLYKEPFHKIWNNARYKALRAQTDFSLCAGEKCNMCHYSIWPWQINRPDSMGYQHNNIPHTP